MKTLYLLTLALALPLAAEVLTPTDEIPADESSQQQVSLHVAQHLNIPDSIGRAGMGAVGLNRADDGRRAVIFFGGANFPNAKPGAKTPEERGAKVFYDTIGSVSYSASGQMKDAPARLPYPVAYAAVGAHGSDIFIAGGCNADGHLSKALLLNPDTLKTTALPELPVTCGYPAYTVLGDDLYIIGGQEKPDSTAALKRVFKLNMADPQKGWQELAPMPDAGRQLAVAGTANGKIYVTGGCSLHPDANGKAERTYLKTTLVYDPAANTWSTAADAPETLVGAATPMPFVEGGLYLIGGDPGEYYRASLKGQAPEEHPGQSRFIYRLDPATGAWAKAGELPLGVATLPSATDGSIILTISGETHPGVRTPKIFHISINK